MKHVMIDIEALDKKPTAAIVSLAAAVFDPMTGRVDASMYRTVNIESSEAAGGTIGADTVKWWFKKSRDVQAAVLSDQAVQLGVALADLNLFVLAYCDADSVKVWARGTDYDMPIISHAMQSIGIRPVWNFWNVRDVRTVEEISLMVCGYASRRLVDENKHNAAADVWNQIAQLSDNLKAIAAAGNDKSAEAAL
ncbi:3'-5' exonuclease [Mangrovibacter phragmitis]|uniref:3'-5' exonuclease n=1 Tax=Mangrovibacter phragmitis TaxID=1691903 RepID=UPI003369D136